MRHPDIQSFGQTLVDAVCSKAAFLRKDLDVVFPQAAGPPISVVMASTMSEARASAASAAANRYCRRLLGGNEAQ